MNSAGMLDSLLNEKKMIVAPGAFNAISAKLIEEAGFEAVYLSGGGLINSMTALPDIGLLSVTEVVEQARHIVNAINLPLIVDIDTGFGEVHNIVRAVKEFESMGVAAVQIEDQVMPKRCGHLQGKSLVSMMDMEKKIRAAKTVAKDMKIIARTDARGVTGLSNAIERALAYERAGADIIFPEALLSEEEFATFRKNIRQPIMANITEFGKTPIIPVSALEGIADIVIFPLTFLRIILNTIKESAAILKTEGTQKNLINKMMTRAELYDLIEYDKFNKLEEKL